jgi:hypothetical protein
MANRSFWILLTIALAFGAAITWIDTRPTWDDTGITAAMILVATSTLGFASPSRVWIPAFGLVHGHHSTLIALVVGFVGAYAGAAARRIITSMAR